VQAIDSFDVVPDETSVTAVAPTRTDSSTVLPTSPQTEAATTTTAAATITTTPPTPLVAIGDAPLPPLPSASATPASTSTQAPAPGAPATAAAAAAAAGGSPLLASGTARLMRAMGGGPRKTNSATDVVAAADVASMGGGASGTSTGGSSTPPRSPRAQPPSALTIAVGSASGSDAGSVSSSNGGGGSTSGGAPAPAPVPAPAPALPAARAMHVIDHVALALQRRGTDPVTLPDTIRLLYYARHRDESRYDCLFEFSLTMAEVLVEMHAQIADAGGMVRPRVLWLCMYVCIWCGRVYMCA
jgi:hypothetical protein